MNITFLMANPKMSGGDRVCAIYAKKLQNLGHVVNVFAPDKSYLSVKQQLRRVIKGEGWLPRAKQHQNHFAALGVSITYVHKSDILSGAALPKADVVIATWWETAEWAALLPQEKGAKAYFIQHHEIHEWLPVERTKKTYSLPLHKITISNWLVDLMRTTYNDPDISLVPNSVDTDQFFAPTRLKNSVPTLGFMYSHVAFKGVDVALRVIENVKQQLPGLKVVCFGINKPNIDYPIPAYFEFIYNPGQEQIRDIYQQLDLWLCCSTTEGFHLPPLEAMACRCPLVSTKVGGPIDIIHQGENGYLCDVGDVASLTEKVLTVFKLSGPEWELMSNAAYATATHYSWDDATALFEKALLHTISKNKP